MTSWCWSGAMALTLVGGVFFWGARVLEVDSFYADACMILLLALLCACLAGL